MAERGSRGEVNVKVLSDMKKALEESNREQLRDMSQKLAHLESNLFSEGK